MNTVATDPALREILGRPFAEQVAFFRGKLGNLISTEVWTDVLNAGHDTGFMVAGAQSADLLQGLAAAMDKAIAQGTGIDAFRKDFEVLVKANGWAYNGEFNWRTRVIYTTNMATSYAAGRLAQLRAGEFPLWIYKHADNVAQPRPLHVAWNGLTLPADDDWWKIHFPPCDWGCHCRVVGARSPAAAARLGGAIRPAPDNGLDPKTGMPAGVGKGWGYMPGDTVSDTVNQMAAKTQQWDYTLAKAYMQNVPETTRDALAEAYRELPSVADDARRYAAQILEQGIDQTMQQYKTLGLLTQADATVVDELVGVDASGYDYSLDRETPLHIRSKHGDDVLELQRGQRAVSADDYRLVPMILNAPDGVEDGGLSDSGAPIVRFWKLIGGERFTTAFEVRTGRKTLTLKSMWVSP